MRWTRWLAATLVLGSMTSAVALWSCAPAAKQEAAAPAPMTAEQRIARGRYLVTVTGCNDCHTPGTLFGAADTTRLLSGSEVGWKGPWGVSIARNLTPDMETGIGSWTEDQIVTGIREGRRPDGSPLMPPMPWPDFAALTDDDAHAVAQYLKSSPAVRHPVPAKVTDAKAFKGPVIPFPPPGAWDAPKGPPPGAPADTSAAHAGAPATGASGSPAPAATGH